MSQKGIFSEPDFQNPLQKPSSGLFSLYGMRQAPGKAEAAPEKRIPFNLRIAYTDFKLISESKRKSSKISIIEARSKITLEIHTLKILQIISTKVDDFLRSNIEWEDEISITLFMQELLHLCSTQPDRVLFNSFIFQELTIAYASRSHASIKSQLEWNKTKPENEEVAPLNLQKMICDVVTDLECLWKERKMRTFGSSINLDNICYSSKSQKYWLENWADTYDKAMAVVSLVEDSDVHLASQDIAEELSAIGLTLIELKGINRAYIEKLRKIITRLMRMNITWRLKRKYSNILIRRRKKS